MNHFRRVQNNHGIILMTVITLSVILSVVAISIISINITQQKSSKNISDTIKAEQLGRGALHKYYQGQIDGIDYTPSGQTAYVELDGKKYYIEISNLGTDGTPSGTSQIEARITSP